MSLSTAPHAEPADAPAAFAGSSRPARRFVFELPLAMRHAGPRRVVLRGEWQGPAEAPVTVVGGGGGARPPPGGGAPPPPPGGGRGGA
ncbi:MAG: hypothetical protein K0M64_05205, partial [Rhizobium sp.]|nr:hypothetical protein [Rhizobium sp.]